MGRRRPIWMIDGRCRRCGKFSRTMLGAGWGQPFTTDTQQRSVRVKCTLLFGAIDEMEIVLRRPLYEVVSIFILHLAAPIRVVAVKVTHQYSQLTVIVRRGSRRILVDSSSQKSWSKWKTLLASEVTPYFSKWNFFFLFGATHHVTDKISRYIGACPLRVKVGNPLFCKNHSNDFPVLWHVARKYLTASASSVAVESMFSMTGLIMNSQHSELKPCKVNYIGLIFFITMLIVELHEFWTAVQYIIHLCDCEWGDTI